MKASLLFKKTDIHFKGGYRLTYYFVPTIGPYALEKLLLYGTPALFLPASQLTDQVIIPFTGVPFACKRVKTFFDDLWICYITSCGCIHIGW